MVLIKSIFCVKKNKTLYFKFYTYLLIMNNSNKCSFTHLYKILLLYKLFLDGWNIEIITKTQLKIKNNKDNILEYYTPKKEEFNIRQFMINNKLIR